MNIYLSFISKQKSDIEKQIILVMVLNGEGWHYLPKKVLSALLQGSTSKHVGNFYNFYCLNSLNLFRTKRKLESQNKL